MKIAILLSLFLYGNSVTVNSFTNADTLFFKNYYKDKVMLNEVYFSSKNVVCFNDNILFDEDKLLKLHGNKITGELFYNLCNLELINNWNVYKHSDINIYSNKYEEFVEERKNELELSYIGKLKLSKNFKSFLILVSDKNIDDHNIIESVFLINVKNNEIVSITRMTNYTCFDGQCDLIYTKKSENGIFIQKNKEVSSDVILPKEEKQDEEKTEVKFNFDSKGRLQML